MNRLSCKSILVALGVAAVAPAAYAAGPAGGVGASPPGAVTGGAASDLPVNKHLVFAIIRNGSQIGQYAMDISTEGKKTTVDVTTDIKVQVLMLTAYRMHHTGHEVWMNGHFVSYKGQTDDNGKPHAVSMTAGQDGEAVIVDGRHFMAPKGSLPGSLWNMKFLQAPALVDPDDGKMTQITVSDMGPEPMTVEGVRKRATHYHIDGLDREVWMVNGSPVQSRLKGSDNSTITSQLEPESAAQATPQ